MICKDNKNQLFCRVIFAKMECRLKHLCIFNQNNPKNDEVTERAFDLFLSLQRNTAKKTHLAEKAS